MKKKVLALVLCLAMVLSVMLNFIPAMSLTASAANSIQYSYYTVDGTTAIKDIYGFCSNYTVVNSTTTNWTGGWYVVDGNVTISSVITAKQWVNLILCDGATLTAEKGIRICGDASDDHYTDVLNIYAQTQGTGKLIATGSDPAGAGIGGGYTDGRTIKNRCGDINIYGGIITATGAKFGGSGIGSGGEGDARDGGGRVTIFDGNVTAIGKDGGAGIGSFVDCGLGSVTIYGGNVNALGGEDGSGICAESITINGGNVIARGEESSFGGSGIGSGRESNSINVTINGGNLTAIGGSRGKGISCEQCAHNGTLNINGGTISAFGRTQAIDLTVNFSDKIKTGIYAGDNPENAQNMSPREFNSVRYEKAFATTLPPVDYIKCDWNEITQTVDKSTKKDIYYSVVTKDTTAFEDNSWYVVNANTVIKGKVFVNGTANLILCDGATLTVEDFVRLVDGNTLNIYSQANGTGKLVVNSREYGAAGIGCRSSDSSKVIGSGNLNVHGGEIIATGACYGAGIGGGNLGNGGNVTIYGGKVVATGNGDAASIGGGIAGYVGEIKGNGGVVTIYDGEVIAITNGGAGIGGGNSSTPGTGGKGATVSIYGGKVIAAGGASAVAIGGGKNSTDNGSLTISKGMLIMGGPNEDNLTEISNVTNEKYVVISKSSEGHSWQDANCTTPKTCSICGETEGEALGHTWQDANCTTPKTCSICGTTEGEALGHTWQDASCTTPKTCSVCGETEGEALGHTWQDATCTTPRTCSRCQTTVGSPLGHDYDALYLVAEATETEGAKYHAVCRRCGDVTDEYMPKAKSGRVLLSAIKVGDILTKATVFEHDYGTALMQGCAVYVDNEFVCRVWFGDTWTIPSCLKCTDVTKSRTSNSKIYFESCCDYTEATCTTPTTCVFCGATEGKALDHTWIDATCTKPKTCSVCGITEGEALGHTWIDATCSKPKTCSVCGATEGKTLDHTWIDATCTEPKTCSVCGATEGKALDHTWIDATCTEPKTCSVCHMTEGKALGHYYVATTMISEATCTQCALYIMECTRCDAKLDSQPVGKPKSHTWLDETCTEPKKCSVCGTKATLSYPLGHEYRPIKKVSDEPLTYSAKCIRCDELTDNYLITDESFDYTDTTTYKSVGKGETLKAGTKLQATSGFGDGELTVYIDGKLAAVVNGGETWAAPYCIKCVDYDTKIIPVRLTMWFETACNYTFANCEDSETCVYCGHMVGAPLGHTWQDGNCTTPKTCSVCGETEGEPLGHTLTAATCTEAPFCLVCHEKVGEPLGHTYENGVCTECGYSLPFAFGSVSLVLSGELGLNFYTVVNDVEAVKDGYMFFEIGNKGETQTVYFTDAVLVGERYVFTCNVNALQMADAITVSFHYGDVTVGPRTTSVAGYIDKVIENHSNDDTNPTVKLAKSIVNYGHYAQLALSELHGFTFGTDYTVTNNKSDVTIANASDLEAYKATKTGSIDGITKVSRSLSLDHGTDINIYLTVKDEYVPNVTVTDKNGNEVECTLEKTGSRYMLVIPQIAAHQLGDTYTVSVDDGAMTVNVSALSYAYSVLSSDKSNAQKLCVSALYEYYNAAISYKESVYGGHSFGEWIDEIPSTCINNGVKAHKNCLICGKNFDADGNEITDLKLPLGEHDYQKCCTSSDSAFHTAAQVCSVCGNIGGESEKEIHTFANKDAEHIVCFDCGFEMLKPSEGINYEVEGNHAAVISTTDENTDDAIVVASIYDGKPVTKIEVGAFSCCTMSQIFLPDTIKEICNYSFAYCDNLTSVVLPEKLEVLGYGVFGESPSITDVTFPDSITSVGRMYFDGENHINIQFTEYDHCYYLGNENNPYLVLCYSDVNANNITIPDGTKVIADYAFAHYGENKMQTIVVPDTIVTVGDYAFATCDALDKVYYKGTKSQWNDIVINNDMMNQDFTDSIRYYYSEKQPLEAGHFWVYVDGTAMEW